MKAPSITSLKKQIPSRMNRLIVFTGIALIFVNIAFANIDLKSSKASYEKDLEVIKRSHKMHMTDLGELYIKALHSLLSQVQKAGDLDKTTAVKNEITRFMLSQTMPEKASIFLGVKNLQETFRKRESSYKVSNANKVISLTSKYQKSLETLQRDLVSSDKLPEARMVRKEREAVMISKEFTMAVQDRNNAVKHDEKTDPPISPSKEMEATLYIAGDDSFHVWLNGKEIGKGPWGVGKGRRRRSGMLYNFPLKIREGDLLAILAKDHGNGNRSAGLYACIVLKDSGKSWSTDKSWSCSTKRQDSRINSNDNNRWLKSPVPLISEGKANEGNVHPSHPSRVPDYRKKYHKSLGGAFIWSAKPSKVVYFKEKIKLSNFK